MTASQMTNIHTIGMFEWGAGTELTYCENPGNKIGFYQNTRISNIFETQIE